MPAGVSPSDVDASAEKYEDVELPDGSFSGIQIFVMMLISPLLLIALVVLVLVWFVSLPFCPWRHESDATEQPKVDDAEAAIAPQYFQSARTGLWVYHRSWWPANQPRAMVFVAHGFGEHCERAGYLELASKLTQRGFAMFALDHQGHGRSTGTRAYFQSINDVVDDLHQFVTIVDEQARTRFPADCSNIPRVIFGHSMGGLIALLSALEMNAPTADALPRVDAASDEPVKINRWNAVIASASAIVVDPELATPPLRLAARVLGAMLPKLVLDGLPPSFISRSDAAVRAYVADPLVWHQGVRARVGREMLRGGEHVCAHANALNMPMLILHGGKDAIVPVLGSKALAARISSARKYLRVFDGGFHEMFEDPDQQSFFQDILTFLEGLMQ